MQTRDVVFEGQNSILVQTSDYDIIVAKSSGNITHCFKKEEGKSYLITRQDLPEQLKNQVDRQIKCDMLEKPNATYPHQKATQNP